MSPHVSDYKRHDNGKSKLSSQTARPPQSNVSPAPRNGASSEGKAALCTWNTVRPREMALRPSGEVSTDHGSLCSGQNTAYKVPPCWHPALTWTKQRLT